METCWHDYMPVDVRKAGVTEANHDVHGVGESACLTYFERLISLGRQLMFPGNFALMNSPFGLENMLGGREEIATAKGRKHCIVVGAF